MYSWGSSGRKGKRSVWEVFTPVFEKKGEQIMYILLYTDAALMI